MQKSKDITKAKQRIVSILFGKMRRSAHQRGVVDDEFFSFTQELLKEAVNKKQEAKASKAV